MSLVTARDRQKHASCNSAKETFPLVFASVSLKTFLSFYTATGVSDLHTTWCAMVSNLVLNVKAVNLFTPTGLLRQWPRRCSFEVYWIQMIVTQRNSRTSGFTQKLGKFSHMRNAVCTRPSLRRSGYEASASDVLIAVLESDYHPSQPHSYSTVEPL